jgi:hypothetical protein
VLDDSETAFTRMDIWGCITGVSGLVLINFAWNQAPVVGWQNPYTYVLLIVGFISMGAFAYIEKHVSKFPLIPPEIMTADTGFLLGCLGLGWSGFGIWVYYFWQFMEGLRNLTPLLTTAQFSPVVLSGLCAAIVAGLLLGRIPGSSIMLIALLAFTTGLILVATAPVEQSYWSQTFVSILLMPWGMYVVQPRSKSRTDEIQGHVISSCNLAAQQHDG